MAPIAVPETVLARFRVVAFERLERTETAWHALTHGTGNGETEKQVFREVHTLKGDAHVLGFPDVGVLCQRLEDLLTAARKRDFRVHEDVDIVVTMAIQFIGMLLRRKPGAPRGGIDLDGFLKQIEDVLSDWLRRRSSLPHAPSPAPLHIRFLEPLDHVSPAVRDRLSLVATSIFLEHLRSTNGAARSRLRDIWRVLAREIELVDAAPLAPIFERHAVSATQLAAELGKSVAVHRDARDAAVAAEIQEAVNTAILHTLRNAVDHGLETPLQRRARGKPEIGTIRLTATPTDAGVEILIEDDGAGVDFAKVRRRAEEKRLIAQGAAFDEQGLLAVLFEPGFSTREVATDVSGRGVGLDAVRAAVMRVGGDVSMRSTAGSGTSIRIRVPRTNKSMDVIVFKGARTHVLFAVPALWSALLGSADAIASADMADLLALPPTSASAKPRVIELRRDRMTISLTAGGVPEPATAFRICPTPVEEQIEIVRVWRTDAILVRPEIILAQRRAARAS